MWAKSQNTIWHMCECVWQSPVKPAGPPDGHWEPWDQTRLNVQSWTLCWTVAVCLPQSVQHSPSQKLSALTIHLHNWGDKNPLSAVKWGWGPEFEFYSWLCQFQCSHLPRFPFFSPKEHAQNLQSSVKVISSCFNTTYNPCAVNISGSSSRKLENAA